MKQNIIERINQLAKEDTPFLFVINYLGTRAYIRRLSDIDIQECLYDFEDFSNIKGIIPSNLPFSITWEMNAPVYSDYKRSFDVVKSNILKGNSYLTNLTCQVPVTCNLSLREIFFHTKSKYKLFLKADEIGAGKQLACFSPETFIKIKDAKIYSYPMKGTLDASLPNAEKILMTDKKEAAEHATIVDLIRNDLSKVATEVRVEKYRYIDRIHTNKGDILQTSSKISGKLPDDYKEHLGDILDTQLPAGSITGAPKDKTMEIICEAEDYQRGFYTGIMGIYSDGELNSAVMIRYIEQDREGKLFKAGGGITSKSECKKEYEEVIQKVYLPII